MPKSALFENFIRADYFHLLYNTKMEYAEAKALELKPKYDIDVGSDNAFDQNDLQDLIDRAIPEDGDAVELLAKERFGKKKPRRITYGDAKGTIAR